MKLSSVIWAAGLVLGLTGVGWTQVAKPAEKATAHDTGPAINAATWECTPGHKISKRRFTLDSGARRYTFLSSGCIDPSHGEERPCAEGNFGMPAPVSANWYWGGFFQVLINGTNATAYRVQDARVIESGARAAFQTIWAHPDATVGLRLMMLPGSNHVLADLVWKSTQDAALETVEVRLTCYPSFFTAAKNRVGERHCQTPRTDVAQPKTLELEPAHDTYLYYYDTVFDMARGEGLGPCAALVAPKGVLGGSVQVGGYAVTSLLKLKPEAAGARLAFYDFSGLTNADAEAYLKAHAAEDLATLERTDFRPAAARDLDPEELQAQVATLLTEAADDGDAMKPQFDELIAKAQDLKARAADGDWVAEAGLATLLVDSADMMWKLRAFAALNAP